MVCNVKEAPLKELLTEQTFYDVDRSLVYPRGMADICELYFCVDYKLKYYRIIYVEDYFGCFGQAGTHASGTNAFCRSVNVR